MANRLRFSGPKTYNPQLARETAQTHRISRDERLRRELGIVDDDDLSVSGSDSGGDEVSHEEIQALKEQVSQLQAAAEEAEKKAAGELSAMQWRLRTSTVTAKKKQQAALDLISEMIDTMYDLEQAVQEAGGTLETSWSDVYDEKKSELASVRSSPMKRPARAAENPEAKVSDTDGGVDVVALVQLRKQVKQLQEELAVAKAAAAASSSSAATNGAGADADADAAAARAEAAEARSAKLQQQLQAAHAKVEDLEGRVEELRNEVDHARGATDAAKGAAATDGAAATAAAAEAAELRAQVTKLRAQLGAASDASSSAASASQQELATVKQALAEAQAAEADSRRRVEDLETRVEEMQRAKEAATQALAAAGSDKDRLHQERVAELEKQVAKASAARKEAEDANQANIQAAQTALATWKEKYTHVKAERKQYKHQLQAAAVDLRKMQEQVAAANAAAEKASKRAAELESTASDLAAKSDSAAGNLSTLEAKLDDAEKRRSEAAANLGRVQDELDAMRAAKDALAAEKARADQQLADATAAASSSEAQIQAMTKQHDEERQQIITILKTKYTKRIDKWKSRAASGSVVIRHHQRFAGGMRQLVNELRTSVADEFGGLQHMMKKQCRVLAKAAKHKNAEVADLREQYRKESKMRKRLFNDLMELRGNIRVFARVRPVVPKEDKEGTEVAVSFPTPESIALVNSKRHKKEWQFDHVFQPGSTNKQVFEQCRDLLTSVVDGYNVCIFAYGQTGAGKTHTMEGRPDNPGLNARTLRLLFDLSRERSGEWTFEIEISLLEIYNETIADLLATEPLTKKLAVKRSEHGNYVPGLTRRRVTSSEEVLDIMRRGYQTRTTFATDSNEHSSRSHCMLSVYVVASNKLTNMVARGKLHLVDLAGSERVSKSGVTGARLKEAQAINKSLSALGNVIASRANKNSHVPFRDSVLTYLLEDSLSNQSKTLMFVNMSPVAANADESFCSLNFAARVRTVELGKASKNVSSGRGSGAGGRPRSRSRAKK